jgi:hypothetical protein
VINVEYNAEKATLSIGVDVPLDTLIVRLTPADIRRLDGEEPEDLIRFLLSLLPIQPFPGQLLGASQNNLQLASEYAPAQQQNNLLAAAQQLNQLAAIWDLPTQNPLICNQLGSQPEPLTEQELDSLQAIKEKSEWPWITFGLPSAP